MIDKLKEILFKQINIGIAWTGEITVKKNIQKINSISYGIIISLIILNIINLINNEYRIVYLALYPISILIINHVVFRVSKNIKLYFGLFTAFQGLITIFYLFNGAFYGASLIMVSLMILSIMHTSSIKSGAIWAIAILSSEAFVFIFHKKIDWIYIYPEDLERLFIRFLIIQTSIFLITYYSIKKQKELYQQVQNEKDMRNRLFVNIVHDLKTPLTIIKNSIDMCLYKENNQEAKDSIKTNISMMEKDVLNILNLERLEKGLVKQDKYIYTNVSILTFNICDAFKSYAKAKNIEIINKVTANIYIKIDKASYTDILNNLLENAVKYSNSGGVITVLLTQNESVVLLTVKDRGIGISNDNIDNIFNSYYQVNSSNDSYYGLGIGLAITRERCEIWNGRISVESNQGEGSIFSVTFPTVKKSDLSSYSIKSESTSIDLNLRDFSEPELIDFNKDLQTILIVEDNIDIRRLLINNFKYTYNLLIAKNGKEALDICSGDTKIDLIITDIMMPVMNGKEFILQLRKEEGSLFTPIIVLTAKTGFDDILEHLSLGALDYINKPFSIDVLTIKVESILNIFKNRQNSFAESIGSNLMSYLSDKSNLSVNRKRTETLNYEKLSIHSITNKELCIIERISEGLSYKEIAFKEGISVNTVKTHIYRIYKKCDVNSYATLLKLFYNS